MTKPSFKTDWIEVLSLLRIITKKFKVWITMAIGKLVGIYIAPDKGEPMRSVDRVRAIADLGLAGDRYALGTGAYSKAKPPKKRDVTLVGREAIEAANAQSGTDFTEAETRRNLVTVGVNLNELVHRLFIVGEVLMYGEELCDPCGRPSKLADKPGFKEAFDNRGGLRASIIEDGLLSIGDVVSPSSNLQIHLQ